MICNHPRLQAGGTVPAGPPETIQAAEMGNSFTAPHSPARCRSPLNPGLLPRTRTGHAVLPTPRQSAVSDRPGAHIGPGWHVARGTAVIRLDSKVLNYHA